MRRRTQSIPNSFDPVVVRCKLALWLDWRWRPVLRVEAAGVVRQQNVSFPAVRSADGYEPTGSIFRRLVALIWVLAFLPGLVMAQSDTFMGTYTRYTSLIEQTDLSVQAVIPQILGSTILA